MKRKSQGLPRKLAQQESHKLKWLNHGLQQQGQTQTKQYQNRWRISQKQQCLLFWKQQSVAVEDFA
jgi:hypothetical protein